MVASLIAGIVVLGAFAITIYMMATANRPVTGQARQPSFDPQSLRTKSRVEYFSRALFDPTHAPSPAFSNWNYGSIEGIRAGTPTMLTVTFPVHQVTSQNMMGRAMGNVPEIGVTVSLRGATPLFYLMPRANERKHVEQIGEGATSDVDFFRVWDTRIDPSLSAILADHDVRRELMRLFLQNPTLGYISVTPQGLTVHWTAERDDVEARRACVMADVALDFQRRILDIIEHRVRIADVNLAGGYRGEPVFLENEAEADAEEENLKRRSSASQD